MKQPFEQLIVVISKKYKKPFNFLRCGADAVFITCSLLLVAVFSLDFTMLREGTWISMLVWEYMLSLPLMQNALSVTDERMKKRGELIEQQYEESRSYPEYRIVA